MLNRCVRSSHPKGLCWLLAPNLALSDRLCVLSSRSSLRVNAFVRPPENVVIEGVIPECVRGLIPADRKCAACPDGTRGGGNPETGSGSDRGPCSS